MADLLDQIIDYEYRAAAHMLVPWFGEDALRGAIECDVTACAAGAAVVEAGGVVVLEDGRRYLVSLGGGESCIAVFLCEADNTALPHLMVLHRSFDIASSGVVQRLVQAVRGLDERAAVQRVCFFQHGERALDSEIFRLRSHYLAALQRDIAACALDDESEPLRAVEPASLDFYDEYMQWYREFWRARPDLEPHVRVESLQDMQQYHEGAGLRLIMFGDEMCGLMAALREVEHGLIGWRIREKVIAPKFWGRGLSVAANVLLARSLPHEEHFAMWGTIAPNNKASLHSAQRVGRRIIGNTYWMNA